MISSPSLKPDVPPHAISSPPPALQAEIPLASDFPFFPFERAAAADHVLKYHDLLSLLIFFLIPRYAPNLRGCSGSSPPSSYVYKWANIRAPSTQEFSVPFRPLSSSRRSLTSPLSNLLASRFAARTIRSTSTVFMGTHGRWLPFP